MFFVVTAAEATAIQTAWATGGEVSAAAEVRRLFKGITDAEDALACARTIAGWAPRDPGPAEGG
jgi:hypothetical protein